jgi:hypothetical protein
MLQFLANLIFGGKPRSDRSSASDVTYTSRCGKTVIADEVFFAWTSGDLRRMLAAIDLKTNPIDRHFLLMGIVAATYKDRKTRESADICERVARIHLSDFSTIVSALRRDMGGTLPRVSRFQHFATLLTEQGRYDGAIQICSEAIGYGLHDGTQGDFSDRIDRIRKKSPMGVKGTATQIREACDYDKHTTRG